MDLSVERVSLGGDEMTGNVLIGVAPSDPKLPSARLALCCDACAWTMTAHFDKWLRLDSLLEMTVHDCSDYSPLSRADFT